MATLDGIETLEMRPSPETCSPVDVRGMGEVVVVVVVEVVVASVVVEVVKVVSCCCSHSPNSR